MIFSGKESYITRLKGWRGGGGVNESVKQKESGRKFSEDSLKYTGKFLTTLKMQVVPEVGNSHT